MGFLVVYITHEDMVSAHKVIDHLLKKRIIACANFFPIKSSYWWKNEVRNSNEVVTIVKTRKKLWGKLKAEVERIHPYETPCIVKLSAEANTDYEEWIKNETE